MSEIRLFNRWTVKKKHFWLGLGLGIPALCVVSFLVFALLAPRIGNVSTAMDTADFGGMAPSLSTGYEMDDGFAMEEAAYDKDTNLAMEIDTSEAVASANAATVTQRLIIREGNISISVDGTVEARSEIQAIVESLAEEGAYIVTSSESGRGEGRQPYINMVVRIPVGQFDAVMDRIAAMGIEVDERYETAQDVTEEYVDLEGRIEAMEISIERLKEFMADAEFTEDLLNAEEQLTIREAELEALQGRLNYLAESAALSSINITLMPYELSEPIDNSWKPAETFRNAVENLVEGLQGFADFMIYFVISVLPFLVIFGLVIWGVVAAVRRRRSKRNAISAE